ncbi:MAG: hypothetical protein ACRDYW_09705, partial [Acidimicrobiales bacterium]
PTNGHDELIERLGGLTEPIHPARQASDLAAMAAVVTPRRGLLASKVRVAAAFLAGLLLGSTGLAAADVLPDPAQHVAHKVLDRVGVQVPDPERYHGPECGATAKRNHGAYVRDDHSLASTDCGKKAKSGGQGADAPGQAKAAKGPCQGKPPWAGSTMTPEAKAAAQAEREAACPDDDGAEAEVEDDAIERDVSPVEPEATTTTAAPTTTTTTTVETTTTTAASTTTPTSGS